MSINSWLRSNTSSLKGKRVAITGSTGGLGREICNYLGMLGADICLLDRNEITSEQHKAHLESKYPDIKVTRIRVDLEDVDSVRCAAEKLVEQEIDVFIHNAGAYSIPRRICTSGYENVFQINFVSPYYMINQLLPMLRKRNGRVVAVGSIAHNYSKIDTCDVDFRKVKPSSKVYGNAKRYLMFSLYSLFEDKENVKLSIVHPGITLTNITAHYPKLIYAIIKHPMKIIFMSPRKAALSIISGLFDDCEGREWIGPRIFDVWGLPSKKVLKTCGPDEINTIDIISREIYSSLISTDLARKS